MMLTEETALTFDIDDRTDPAQSIGGGARYLAHIMGKLPEAGAGAGPHLLCARGLQHRLRPSARCATPDEDRGGDWNRWADVQPSIRLLSTPEFSAQTRHGFARGGETLYFVNNVRNYFNVLSFLNPGDGDDAGWMQQRSAPAPVQAEPRAQTRSPARPVANRRT